MQALDEQVDAASERWNGANLKLTSITQDLAEGSPPGATSLRRCTGADCRAAACALRQRRRRIRARGHARSAAASTTSSTASTRSSGSRLRTPGSCATQRHFGSGWRDGERELTRARGQQVAVVEQLSAEIAGDRGATGRAPAAVRGGERRDREARGGRAAPAADLRRRARRSSSVSETGSSRGAAARRRRWARPSATRRDGDGRSDRTRPTRLRLRTARRLLRSSRSRCSTSESHTCGEERRRRRGSTARADDVRVRPDRDLAPPLRGGPVPDGRAGLERSAAARGPRVLPRLSATWGCTSAAATSSTRRIRATS